SLANLVRNVASSMAESPPPTTTTFLSLKKKPSQVAHAETPWPRSRVSDGRPSHLADDPVATTTARAACTPDPDVTLNGRTVHSTCPATGLAVATRTCLTCSTSARPDRSALPSSMTATAAVTKGVAWLVPSARTYWSFVQADRMPTPGATSSGFLSGSQRPLR